jgi:hypothetical protein
MNREMFVVEYSALIENLRQLPHHPEEKIRVLMEHIHDGWEDRMFIWALEASGEEDVMIEIIAQYLGWDENRVMDALEAAGWTHERSLRVFYKAMTGLA